MPLIPGMGYGLGDAAKALQIANWILDNCFNSVKNGSILYVEFLNDVRDLAKRVEQFRVAFGDAAEQAAEDQPELQSLQRESGVLAGDFRTTVQDCERLLKRYAKFERGQATALDSGFWNAKTQPRVDDLRRRLKFHSYKIDLIVEPVALKLSTNTNADLYDIRASLLEIQRHLGLVDPTQLPDIPLSIQTALERALSRNCPVPFAGPQELPLAQGVEALSLHYCNSIEGSTSIGPDIRQKLGLLKAHWLFNTIKSSSTLAHSRSGSLYPRIVDQNGEKIEERYRSLNIKRWTEDDFSALGDDAWAIWPVKEIPKPPAPTDPAGREEKIVEVTLFNELPESKKDLIIFRVNDQVLRVVLSQVMKSTSANPQTVYQNSSVVKLSEIGLVPIYAGTRANGNRHGLMVTNTQGAGSELYEFESLEDALRVQSAFTGHTAIPPRVKDGDPLPASITVTCIVTYQKKSLLRWNSVQDTADGEAQIWRPRLPRRFSSGSPVNRRASSTNPLQNTYAESQHSVASKAFQNFNRSVVAVTEAANGKEQVVASKPPSPLLVFLVRNKLRYTIWQTDLSQLVIRKELQYKGKKFRSLLERLTAKEFPLHRLSVDKSQIELWNVCAVAANDPSNLKNSIGSSVETVASTCILLDFKNEKEQSDFELCFKFAKGERSQLEQQFNRSMHVAQSQEHKPARALPVIVGRSPTPSSRSQSLSHSGSSEAPRLDPITPSSPLLGEDPDDKDLEAMPRRKSTR